MTIPCITRYRLQERALPLSLHLHVTRTHNEFSKMSIKRQNYYKFG